MIAKEPRSTSIEALEKMAADTIKSQMRGGDAPTVRVTDNTTSVRVEVTAKVDTTFSLVAGQDGLVVKTASEVLRPVDTVFEIAFALDNTGSMAGSNKLTVLKQGLNGTNPTKTDGTNAELGFLNVLAKMAKTTDDYKVSIVPFSLFVRVNPSTFPSNLLKTSAYPDPFLGCVTDRDQTGSWNHDVLATTPSSSDNNTKFSYDAPLYNVSKGVKKPMPVSSSYCGIQTMVPLKSVKSSTDLDALHAEVTNMTASGNTNIPIGLNWGRYMLTNGFPTSTAASGPPVNKQLRRILILMTDGDNTQNRWTNSTSSIDSLTRESCKNTKNANIEIFTVRIVAGNATLLQDCASAKQDGAKAYWNAATANDLLPIFDQILREIVNIRISS